MTYRTLIAAAAFIIFAAPALAFHCPLDMKKIDAALAKGTVLGEYELDKVAELRAEGERLHKAGQHKEAVEALGLAMRMLGVK